MIVEMPLSTWHSHRAAGSRGSTECANFVANQSTQGRRSLQRSFAFGLDGKGAFNQLDEVFNDCRQPNWDGYGAAAVTADAYRLAIQFLDALPLGTPVPSIGAEPDGDLTLEWHRSPRRTLSISVSPEAVVHYAALLGAAKTYGTEPFFGDVPDTIVGLIHRVTAP